MRVIALDGANRANVLRSARLAESWPRPVNKLQCPSRRLCPTAANSDSYTEETGAKQNETTGFGDRDDRKGDGLIVGMLSIRNENVRVGAGGGEIAL
jgi:hypothetical protein